jgi:hypothetical protein
MKVRMPGHHPEYSRMPSEDASVVLDRTEAMLHEAQGIDEKVDKQEKVSDFAPAMFDTSVMANSQESLSDTLPTSADISSTDDASGDGSVSSSVMLLCVSALPYVLQVDKVMSMFLARGGLSKLTGLLDYQQMRAPVMSVFEALVMIDERRLRGTTVSNHKSVYEGGGVIQTFIDTLAKKTCTVTATLQQISLQSSNEAKVGTAGSTELNSNLLSGNLRAKDESEARQSSLFNSSSFSEKTTEKPSVYQPTILAELHPSNLKDPQSNKGTVKTETSESEADESPYSGMTESLPVLLDMWKTCAKLCMNSRMFRACYRESPCLYVVQVRELIFIFVVN